MSGNLTAVSEMSGKKILSGKSGLKLFIVSCIFASIQVFVGVCSVLNITYMVSAHALLPPLLTVTLVPA